MQVAVTPTQIIESKLSPTLTWIVMRQINNALAGGGHGGGHFIGVQGPRVKSSRACTCARRVVLRTVHSTTM